MSTSGLATWGKKGTLDAPGAVEKANAGTWMRKLGRWDRWLQDENHRHQRGCVTPEGRARTRREEGGRARHRGQATVPRRLLTRCVKAFFFFFLWRLTFESMNLSKLQDTVEDRGAWHATVNGSRKVRHNLVTEQQHLNQWTVRKGDYPPECLWALVSQLKLLREKKIKRLVPTRKKESVSSRSLDPNRNINASQGVQLTGPMLDLPAHTITWASSSKVNVSTNSNTHTYNLTGSVSLETLTNYRETGST